MTMTLSNTQDVIQDDDSMMIVRSEKKHGIAASVALSVRASRDARVEVVRVSRHIMVIP